MHQEHGLPFRSYVPTLMELLEDADGVVRDTAKTTVIELFRYVSRFQALPRFTLLLFCLAPCAVRRAPCAERRTPSVAYR